MEQHATPRRRLAIVATLAALAVVLVLAVAAWADSGGDPSPARSSGDSSTLPVQSERPQQQDERGDDCPEKRDGRGGSGSSSGETAPSALEL
jgi:hypothetical protein